MGKIHALCVSGAALWSVGPHRCTVVEHAAPEAAQRCAQVEFIASGFIAMQFHTVQDGLEHADTGQRIRPDLPNLKGIVLADRQELFLFEYSVVHTGEEVHIEQVGIVHALVRRGAGVQHTGVDE